MALKLGCTVRELLRRIDSRELSEWQAFAQLEPFGGPWDDLQTGHITAMMATLWSKSTYTPEQMALTPRDTRQTVDEQMMILRELTSKMGGSVSG